MDIGKETIVDSRILNRSAFNNLINNGPRVTEHGGTHQGKLTNESGGSCKSQLYLQFSKKQSMFVGYRDREKCDASIDSLIKIWFLSPPPTSRKFIPPFIRGYYSLQVIISNECINEHKLDLTIPSSCRNFTKAQ